MAKIENVHESVSENQKFLYKKCRMVDLFCRFFVCVPYFCFAVVERILAGLYFLYGQEVYNI